MGKELKSTLTSAPVSLCVVWHGAYTKLGGLLILGTMTISIYGRDSGVSISVLNCFFKL